MDELKIIELCLLGKTKYFSRLIDNYRHMIYNLAYRMSNNLQEAEDIAQETFIKAFQYLDHFNPNYKFSTWLYQIALNIIRDRFKKKEIFSYSLDTPKEGADTESLPPEPVDHTHNPEYILTRKEEAELIQRAINALPLKYKEVIILRHIQDLSYLEIARILKLSESTVKIRLFRAREQLKKEIEKKGTGYFF
ncbi:MAG: RNA polymerase sigma factor SigW [Candidatus Caldatribacteriota bacterium]